MLTTTAALETTIYRVRVTDRLAGRTDTHECTLAHLAALESTPLPAYAGRGARFVKASEPVSLGYTVESKFAAIGSGGRE